MGGPFENGFLILKTNTLPQWKTDDTGKENDQNNNQNKGKKGRRQPYDCLVEWHFCFCLQQKFLSPGGAKKMPALPRLVIAGIEKQILTANLRLAGTDEHHNTDKSGW
jgi:hypothetical protein